MDPAIKQAGQLRQKLQADIANLLNDYTAATGLRIDDLRLNPIHRYGPEAEAYTVSVDVKL